MKFEKHVSKNYSQKQFGLLTQWSRATTSAWVVMGQSHCY